MGTIVEHPLAKLMAAVQAERAVADSPKARGLQEAMCNAVAAYYDFLDSHGLAIDEEYMLARRLHVIHDGVDFEIVLEDGPIDRRYGHEPD